MFEIGFSYFCKSDLFIFFCSDCIFVCFVYFVLSILLPSNDVTWLTRASSLRQEANLGKQYWSNFFLQLKPKPHAHVLGKKKLSNKQVHISLQGAVQDIIPWDIKKTVAWHFVNKYMKDHIFELRRKIWICDWLSQFHTQLKKLWN